MRQFTQQLRAAKEQGSETKAAAAGAG